jgi:glycosyltransferase involved in cell wall biosynthesis
MEFQMSFFKNLEQDWKNWLKDNENEDNENEINTSNTNDRMVVLRTGVDLKDFKPRNKKWAQKKIKLDTNLRYALTIGRGGYWTKGVDRAVQLSEHIYKKDKNFRLLLVGFDYKKIKKIIKGKENFVIYYEKVDRKDIPYFYNSSDIYFCFSRYEGGAPTLTVAEAMASGCFVVCSKDSKQEIIKSI